MVNTVTAAEEAIDYWGRFRERSLLPVVSGISDAITHSCCLTAMDLNASAILAATRSGVHRQSHFPLPPRLPHRGPVPE